MRSLVLQRHVTKARRNKTLAQTHPLEVIKPQHEAEGFLAMLDGPSCGLGVPPMQRARPSRSTRSCPEDDLDCAASQGKSFLCELTGGAAESQLAILCNTGSRGCFRPARVALHCLQDTRHLPFREGHGGPTLLTEHRTPTVKAAPLARHVSSKVPPSARLIFPCTIFIVSRLAGG